MSESLMAAAQTIAKLEAENLRLTDQVHEANEKIKTMTVFCEESLKFQERYREALEKVPTAINDAITKLYPEECSKATRGATEKRCRDNGGTLAYLVNVRMRIEAILAESDSEPKPGEGEKP